MTDWPPCRRNAAAELATSGLGAAGSRMVTGSRPLH
jgi:7-keto-8-aminopelargonate synthetase-like enzyme